MTTKFLLTDNGSYRPEATRSLRRIARELSSCSGHEVEAVSLLHSGKIDPSEIDGIPAQTFEPFLRSNHGSCSSFVVVPLFFGPSAAPFEFLPQRASAIAEELGWDDLEIRIAPCLVNTSDSRDTRIADILADGVKQQISEHSLETPAVALCDHGAPRVGVTQVRNFLAEQLAHRLGQSVATVTPCSMERRPGPEYDFNEPLLENILLTPEFSKQVVVSMLFFQPGRHAGPAGDIAEICQGAAAAVPSQQTHMTDLVGTHSGLVPILADRLKQGLEASPFQLP